jgi:hypothetical protein
MKVEGVTGSKSDIILMSDCRVGNNKKEIESMFRLSVNGNYTLYLNSTQERRGTGIAVKRDSNIIVEGEYRVGRGENSLVLKIKKGTFEFLVGIIYGPNENDVDFYKEISQFLEREKLPFVLGGDFNTILDQRRGGGGKSGQRRGGDGT